LRRNFRQGVICDSWIKSHPPLNCILYDWADYEH
jgi:hypothetical protein